MISFLSPSSEHFVFFRGDDKHPGFHVDAYPIIAPFRLIELATFTIGFCQYGALLEGHRKAPLFLFGDV